MLQGDKEVKRQEGKETGIKGDRETGDNNTRRQRDRDTRDKETRRQGDR
jgi:hypothetical protein